MTGDHWTERWARRTAPDLGVCNSQHTAEAFRRIYPGIPSTVVLPPLEMPQTLLPADDRAWLREELSTPDSAIVIVQAGRLEPLKGHAVLLDALGALGDLPGWILWQAGGAQRPFEQTYLDSLRARAARLGIAGRVRFVGHRADMSRIFAAADLQCQPNTGPEGFRLVFVEALAAGLPVVGARSGGVVEIIDDSCGVLVPPGDATALARALRELITDPARRLARAQAAPARARRLCDPAAQLRILSGALTAMDSRRDAA